MNKNGYFCFKITTKKIKMAQTNVQSLLGDQAEYLLNHTCNTISKENIHLPGSDFVDRVFAQTNRNTQVLKSLQNL